MRTLYCLSDDGHLMIETLRVLPSSFVPRYNKNQKNVDEKSVIQHH